MASYKVEVIFEPTGDYMNFTYDTESDNEDSISNEIINQLSIVLWRNDNNE